MKAGFIGLGAMGGPMAKHLARRGLLGGVWNRTVAKAQVLGEATGAPVARDPGALWAACEVVVLCVRADDEVREVCTRLATPAGRDRLVVDTSTISADTAREVAGQLAASGLRFLDAPVTGGTEGAKDATLTFMVGGDAIDVEAAAPLFDAMGSRSVHMGRVGAGQATKAVNQVACAGIAQGVTEAMAFADALELPLDRVLDVVGSGAAGSWFMTHRGANFVRGDYPPGFKLALHHKDLAICLRMATALGGRLPVTEATLPAYEALMADGHGGEDISALYRRNRGLFPKRKP